MSFETKSDDNLNGIFMYVYVQCIVESFGQNEAAEAAFEATEAAFEAALDTQILW